MGLEHVPPGMTTFETNSPRINLDAPRYDQSTFNGRAKHFFITTNPLNLFASGSELENAKDIVERYRKGENLKLSEDEIWKAKNVYDSAYHPDTKEKMLLIGRMSAQVPMNMTITGCMLTFYKSRTEVIFWQWINQSFNAIVNYTNRSGDSPISLQRLGISYVLATSGAIATAMNINKLVTRFPPIVGRFVPFLAASVANCINIPCMRSREVMNGIPVFDDDGNRLGNSKTAAKSAITQVVFSRIAMATPGMCTLPFIMDQLDKKPFMKRMPWLAAPLQVSMIGILLIFATPLCCALFPQKSSIAVSSLEPELQDITNALPNRPKYVYFNKGL